TRVAAYGRGADAARPRAIVGGDVPQKQGADRRARTRRGPTDAPRGGAALPAPRGRMTLPERVVALHRALAKPRIPHALGGAIALAYWTQDPRGTSDIDLNVFIPARDCARAAQAPAGRRPTPPTRRARSRETARSGCGGTRPLSTSSSTTRTCTRKRHATAGPRPSRGHGSRYWARSSSRSSR